jgi:hypothetical protein
MNIVTKEHGAYAGMRQPRSQVLGGWSPIRRPPRDDGCICAMKNGTLDGLFPGPQIERIEPIENILDAQFMASDVIGVAV